MDNWSTKQWIVVYAISFLLGMATTFMVEQMIKTEEPPQTLKEQRSMKSFQKG